MHVRNVGGGSKEPTGKEGKGSADPRMLLGSDSDHLLVCLLFSSHNQYRLFALCQHFWLYNPSHKKEMKGGTLEGKERRLLGVSECSGL